MNSSPGNTRSTSTASRAYAPHAPSNIGPSLRYARSERGQGPCSTSCTLDSHFRNGLLVCHLATGQPLATALRLLRGTRSRAGRSDSKRKVKKGKITLGSEGLLFLQKEAPGLSSIPRGSRQPLSLASSCEIRNRLLDAAISCGPFAKTLPRACNKRAPTELVTSK